jgi:hypothetical protein
VTAVNWKLPRMSRADRHRWAGARTVADLGELMALWLEGEIGSRPGYAARYGPDPETAELVPLLAALCRTGLITTCSQPGLTGFGVDGQWWQQRAAVELVATDQQVLEPLILLAHSAGLIVRIHDHRHDEHITQEHPVAATLCGGEVVTRFGSRITRADMTVQWPGLRHPLYEQITHGTYLNVIAPEYGAAGQHPWENVLDLAVRAAQLQQTRAPFPS